MLRVQTLKAQLPVILQLQILNLFEFLQNRLSFDLLQLLLKLSL